MQQSLEEAKKDGKEKDIAEKKYGTLSSKWFGAFLSVYTVEQYSEMKMFLLTDGSGGMAIKKNGDIVSVFRNATRCRIKNLLEVLIPAAIKEGGNHLDCFDGLLPKKYSKYGFKPVAKIKFDITFAPTEWNFERDNHPDVIFMVFDIVYSKTVEQDDEIRGISIKEFIAKMPFSTYEEAEKKQLELIKTVEI